MSYLLIDEGATAASGRRRGSAGEVGSLGEALERARRAKRAGLGLAGLGAASVLASSVRSVTLRSQVTPEVTWRPGARGAPGAAQQSGGGFGAWLLSVVRPDVEVDTAMGKFRVAPYGTADATYWPLLAAGGAIVGGTALFLAARGAVAVWRDLSGGGARRLTSRSRARGGRR